MKKHFITYRLTFTTPLHIGDYKPFEYGSSLKYIHSDTLRSALLAVRAQYGLSIPEDGDSGFVISSLFPFINGVSDDCTYFFPKPITGLPVLPEQVKSIKKVKKVSWLDGTYMTKLLSGEKITDFGGKECEHIRGSLLSKIFKEQSPYRNEEHPVFESQVSQRVSIPRIRNSDDENRLFSMERLYFREDAGLYFIFDGTDAQRHWLEESLDLLKMEGLGTDRNIGHGIFTWNSDQVSIEIPDDAQHILTLGLYHPEDQATLSTMVGDDDSIGWKLLKRGGWITDPAYQSIRKRSVYMFTEGSVFKKPGNFKGHIGLPAINLQPRDDEGDYPVNHPIWRCGRTLAFPIKINE